LQRGLFLPQLALYGILFAVDKLLRARQQRAARAGAIAAQQSLAGHLTRELHQSICNAYHGHTMGSPIVSECQHNARSSIAHPAVLRSLCILL
jgi:hypothetical protein